VGSGQSIKAIKIERRGDYFILSHLVCVFSVEGMTTENINSVCEMPAAVETFCGISLVNPLPQF